MTIPKKGNFVIWAKCQEQWDDLLNQLGGCSDVKKYFSKYPRNAIHLVDGKFDGYSQLEFFQGDEWEAKTMDVVFIELENNGYSHRLGTPNWSETEVLETEYVQL